MKILAKVLSSDKGFDLGVELIAGEVGLSRPISVARVQKPGLALAGYIASLRPECVQVLGNTEMSYLGTLSAVAQASAIDGLVLETNIACVVLTNGLEPPARLLEAATSFAIPIFRTALATEPFINRIHNLLDEYLSPEETVHGVVVDVFGVGVMLFGHSGIGKSECALDLILRGHRLVADDVVRITQQGRMLLAMGSPITRHHMEVRGLGIINVRDLFGAAAVREKKRIELIVELVEWEPGVEYDRTGIEDATESILDVDVPKVRLPIRPGRPVASIVEVAARNHLLKMQGHHSARDFKESLERRLATAEDRLAAGENE